MAKPGYSSSLLYRRVSKEDIKKFRKNMERLNLKDIPVTREIAEEGPDFEIKEVKVANPEETLKHRKVSISANRPKELSKIINSIST